MSGAESKPIPIDEHTLSVQRLFVHHQQHLKAFVLSLTPDFTIADDVMQETFLEISRKAADFQMESNFTAWARCIAKYKLLSILRDRQRASARLADDIIEALAASAPIDDDDESRHFADVCLLRKCLDKLPPRARELIRLRYFGEHLPGEIAQLRSQSINAINVTLARARAALRLCMERSQKAQE